MIAQRVKFIFLVLAVAILSGCGALHSTTFIPPSQKFELGNNKHGAFTANVKNLGDRPIEVYRAPIDGGKHSFVTLAAGASAKIKVEPNTALVVNNMNQDTASVKLIVRGDISLGMQYK